jgi:hypothetical protein
MIGEDGSSSIAVIETTGAIAGPTRAIKRYAPNGFRATRAASATPEHTEPEHGEDRRDRRPGQLDATQVGNEHADRCDEGGVDQRCSRPANLYEILQQPGGSGLEPYQSGERVDPIDEEAR